MNASEFRQWFATHAAVNPHWGQWLANMPAAQRDETTGFWLKRLGPLELADCLEASQELYGRAEQPAFDRHVAEIARTSARIGSARRRRAVFAGHRAAGGGDEDRCRCSHGRTFRWTQEAIAAARESPEGFVAGTVCAIYATEAVACSCRRGKELADAALAAGERLVQFRPGFDYLCHGEDAEGLSRLVDELSRRTGAFTAETWQPAQGSLLT